ncbi:MAG: ribosome maturation factor RimM [Legionellales bacterium]|nr:ribosome maturation factor RimM [Legionellales bacterium]
MIEKKSLLPEDRYIVVGQFAKTFGVSGWIKVNSYTDPVTNLIDYDPWFYKKNQTWVRLPLQDRQIQGDSIIVLIEGYDNPESARAFSGVEIAVKRIQFPSLPEGEHFWCDLIELDVITTTGVKLGKVSRIYNAGGNDLLVVQGEKEHLIPYIKGRFVVSIDIPSHQIVVDWDPDF